MDPKARPRLVVTVFAAAVVSVGAAVVAHHFGWGWRGLRGMRLTELLCAGVTAGVGVFFCRRILQRRARMEAIADLLPRYRAPRLEEEFLFEDQDLDGEAVEHLPKGRAAIRAATRALLVSLEDEMLRDTTHKRRSGRPACRRARLRAAGRSAAGRRRVSPRLASSPS